MNISKPLMLTLFLAATSAGAADPAWLAAFTPNDAGGAIALGSMQKPPCTGEWYNAVSSRPNNKEKPLIQGCWKFTDRHITINWEDGAVIEYPLRVFHWSDWATAGIDQPQDAQPQKPSAPAPRIQHKSDDIIS